MSFLHKLDEHLKEKWTFDEPMPIQDQLIPEMLEGKDVIAISPTGTGKTLAYVLPLLQMADGTKKATQALIVAPSQELSMQILEVIRTWAKGSSITVAQLIGGANIQRQIEQLKKKPTIVVGTPGRIIELIQQKKLKMQELRHLVLDEGDQLLSRENRELTKSIVAHAFSDIQMVLVSATVSDEIELTASRIMKNPSRIYILSEDIPSQGQITHSFIKTEVRDKTDLLRRLSHIKGIKAIAFVNHLDQLLMKSTKLKYHDASIAALHSEMKKDERKKAIESFKKGETSILIATDVAARGLDIEGVTHVIHTDFPKESQTYLHRSGRTARAGADGEVLSFITYEDEKNYKKMMKELSIKPVQKIWKNGKLIEGNSKSQGRKYQG